ncbi:uncharacterized protein LOC130836817 [Hippopotamus amphibius kiboko]|uniref:uncharacterized protein LOC130836817 n=1 Tax=Hippopotamus amphibius kiboko TaxID=575201 RepID=UPI0025983A96|nr:uncharacterized protein LOC130836817 [Hippopotamus amphibius kiboko]
MRDSAPCWDRNAHPSRLQTLLPRTAGRAALQGPAAHPCCLAPGQPWGSAVPSAGHAGAGHQAAPGSVVGALQASLSQHRWAARVNRWHSLTSPNSSDALECLAQKESRCCFTASRKAAFKVPPRAGGSSEGSEGEGSASRLARWPLTTFSPWPRGPPRSDNLLLARRSQNRLPSEQRRTPPHPGRIPRVRSQVQKVVVCTTAEG